MKLKYTLLVLLSIIAQVLPAQGYTNWVVGDTADFVSSTYQGGLVLAGGAGDNDDAMQWMLQRAGGGDVLVIRASNSDGYNDYFFSGLDIPVNSVETIRFDDAEAATDPYVLRRLAEAEILFIAGGDQFDYYQLWKDSPVETTINALLNTKGITVGGTSAGMAILGHLYYTPSGSALDTEEALGDPFHPDFDILGKDDFLQAPFMENIITDTHYDQRDRPGRHLAFLARALNDFGTPTFGIACNEYTAVCIDTEGQAVVYGESPEYPDYAYFLQTNCQAIPQAEVMSEGSPLTWDRSQSAIKAFRLPGTTSGSTPFDLTTWTGGADGEWENWYVTEGNFFQEAAPDGDCASVITSTSELNTAPHKVNLSPNPVANYLEIKWTNTVQQAQLQVINTLGQVVYSSQVGSVNQHRISTPDWPAGSYRLLIQQAEQLTTIAFVKQP